MYTPQLPNLYNILDWSISVMTGTMEEGVDRPDSVDRTRASIRIYTYRKEIKHKLTEIEKTFVTNPKRTIPLRTIGQPNANRYAVFEFEKVDGSDNKKVIYSAYVTRDVVDVKDEAPIRLYHDICFTAKGFLIITGMQHRQTLLKCLTEHLHGNRSFAFKPRQMSKSEVQDFVELLPIPDINRVYQPRFHSYVGYRNREFNDFRVSEDRCATEDDEYNKLLKNCDYFDPIFKINKICEEELPKEGKLRMNHDGYFYSSRRMLFEHWLQFVSTYIPWCL